VFCVLCFFEFEEQHKCDTTTHVAILVPSVPIKMIPR